LLQRMDLVQVPGKRNRRVPILITPEVGRAMQLLVNTRSRCGVAEENSYFFVSDSKDGHLDSRLVLHNMSVSAGVTSPRLITSCRLRKYIVTLAQVRGLSAVGAFLQATSRVPRWWIGERPPDMAASCDIYK